MVFSLVCFIYYKFQCNVLLPMGNQAENKNKNKWREKTILVNRGHVAMSNTFHEVIC